MDANRGNQPTLGLDATGHTARRRFLHVAIVATTGIALLAGNSGAAAHAASPTTQTATVAVRATVAVKKKVVKKKPTIKLNINRKDCINKAVWETGCAKGQPLRMTVTVKAGKKKLPGKVVFYDGKKKLKTIKLKKGKAYWELWTKRGGVFKMAARYVPTGAAKAKYKAVTSKRYPVMFAVNGVVYRPTVAEVRKIVAPYSKGTVDCGYDFELGGAWISDTSPGGFRDSAKNMLALAAPYPIKIRIWRYNKDMIAMETLICDR